MQNYGRLFSKIYSEQASIWHLFASRHPLSVKIGNEMGISADFGACQSARIIMNTGGH